MANPAPTPMHGLKVEVGVLEAGNLVPQIPWVGSAARCIGAYPGPHSLPGHHCPSLCSTHQERTPRPFVERAVLSVFPYGCRIQ